MLWGKKHVPVYLETGSEVLLCLILHLVPSQGTPAPFSSRVGGKYTLSLQYTSLASTTYLW